MLIKWTAMLYECWYSSFAGCNPVPLAALLSFRQIGLQVRIAHCGHMTSFQMMVAGDWLCGMCPPYGPGASYPPTWPNLPLSPLPPLPYFPIAQRSHHFISPWSHLPTVPPSLCPIIQSPICAISHHTLPPVPLPHCSLVPSPQSNLPRAPSSHVSSHCLIIPLADCALLAENARSESAPQPLSRKGGGKAGFMRTMKAAGSWCLMAKSFSVERVLYLFLSERNQFWWSSDEKWIVQLTHYYIIHILSKKKNRLSPSHCTYCGQGRGRYNKSNPLPVLLSSVEKPTYKQ